MSSLNLDGVKGDAIQAGIGLLPTLESALANGLGPAFIFATAEVHKLQGDTTQDNEQKRQAAAAAVHAAVTPFWGALEKSVVNLAVELAVAFIKSKTG